MKILCVYCIPIQHGNSFKDFVHNFFSDMKNYSTGISFDFMIAFKDSEFPKYVGASENEIWKRSGVDRPDENFKYSYVVHQNENKDIWTFVEVAKAYEKSDEYDYIVYLSTSTRICANDWLATMINCFQQDERIAIVGTHGSYLFGAFKYIFNPHVRTNCFAVRKSFLPFVANYTINHYFDIMNFEHGPDSIFVRAIQQGLKGVTVGKDGKAVEWFDWKDNEGGYGLGGWNLLVKDRHTMNDDLKPDLFPHISLNERHDIFKDDDYIDKKQMTRTLPELNNSHTDKNTTHTYLDLYQKLLQHKKLTAKNVLEIGIGGSIKLWHDYFVNAQIYGVDIISFNDVWAGIKNIPKITLFTQTDGYNPEFIKHNFIDKNIKFDMVIDDGPHNLPSQIDFIKLYLPLLADDGILILEDIQSVDWLFELVNCVPKDHKQYITLYDLRRFKGRYDDIVLVINKSGFDVPPF